MILSRLAAAVLLLSALAARAQTQELSEDRARQILPRVDLGDLTGVQRAQFLEVAGDTFDYAGCSDTLARCLQSNVQDKHALRMAQLVKMLIRDGLSPTAIVDLVERYYSSFPKEKRQRVSDQDCATLGDPKAPVVVVEFSDFQCPHCATAQKPLRQLVESSKGKVRLCSKEFPLPGHPRAAIAAASAEWARQKGKFWEMSELLFAHQDELDDARLASFARQLDLDGNAMLRDVYAGKLDSIVEKHRKEGAEAGIRATPTLFFNGRQHVLTARPEYLLHSAQDEEEWQRNKGGWDKE